MDSSMRERLGILKPRLAAAIAALAVAGSAGCSASEKAPCEPFRVYAQNRWAPQGASLREEPDVLAEKAGSFAGNEVIAVDGWVDTDEPAYPTNPAPWNSDVWLHHKGGWVAYAAVRAEPTEFDSTSRDPDGGEPVTLKPECQIELSE